MQQRQLRLGDILDDYCPRERRVTNHAVVAMIGEDVKQTRCTTCDTEHEYKHAKVPRQRRKSETPTALHSPLAGGPKRVAHESHPNGDQPALPDSSSESSPHGTETDARSAEASSDRSTDFDDPSSLLVTASSNPIETNRSSSVPTPEHAAKTNTTPVAEEQDDEDDDERPDEEREGGPVHRPLIRASLPRPEGAPPPTRPAPEFTIRQPGGRPNRFRPRHVRGVQPFQNNRSNGNLGGVGSTRGGGRPPMISRLAKRHGPGRKRSK